MKKSKKWQVVIVRNGESVHRGYLHDTFSAAIDECNRLNRAPLSVREWMYATVEEVEC